MTDPLQPAHITFLENGTPYSPKYDDVYHAKAGGLAQARSVFLAGNGLPERWQGQNIFTILETGFGQGLNFLAAWDAWRSCPTRSERLHFLSVEKHPTTRDDLVRLHTAYPELALLATQLQSQWPVLTRGLHRLEFEEGRVVLTLALGDAMAALPQFVASPDAVFLDGFSPAKNPALWSYPLLNELALMCHPGTTLATWSVASSVREVLTRVGFSIEKRRGFARKGEMLVGHLPDAGNSDINHSSGVAASFSRVGEQRAIVVGAGLAGCMVSEALGRRGWSVDLFERQAAPAMETSSNLTAVMLPMLSLDDNRASRLNRACYLHALRTVKEWRSQGLPIDGDTCGVLQIARDAEHASKQREILARCGFPTDYVRWIDADEAGRETGTEVSGGGWWFEGGAWWNPTSLCRAALQKAGKHVRLHTRSPIESIAQDGEMWCVFDASGKELARASHLILASAHDLLRLPQTAHLPLFRFRGQVSHFSAPTDSPLRAVVCKEGYISPAYQGQHCVGASFHRGGEPALRDADHVANIERLRSMLPKYLPHLTTAHAPQPDGKVGFRPVSPDKLPIVGTMYRPDATPQGRDLSAVERWPGLYVASGFGARGLVWSVLMGELLACQIHGDPLPLESELAATVDPARFLSRRKD